MTTQRIRARRWLATLVTGVAALVTVVIMPASADAASAQVAAQAASARAASATAAQPVWSGVGYLALGDSVAFGYRPPQVTPPADYLDAANFVGYPEDLARFLRADLANASCPGETTGSFIEAGAQSNGCENSVGSPIGYRTKFPLHVSYTGTQMDYAIQYLDHHPDTRLVTIDIGANDVFVCQQVNADQCTGSDFQATLAQIAANLTTIYTALRDRAHYHHGLVLLSYYASNYASTKEVAAIKELNAALAGPTRRFGGIVADGFGAFEQAAKAHGGDVCAAGLEIALPGGGCNVHPTPYGHLVLARAIARSIARYGLLSRVSR